MLLMSAARKNVEDQMSEQSRQIIASKGISAGRDDWASIATEVAQKVFESRTEHGNRRVDIGRGAFMSQDEINRIAAKNVLPIIQRIDRQAEAHHQSTREAKAHELELLLEHENDKRGREIQHQRKLETEADIRKSRAYSSRD